MSGHNCFYLFIKNKRCSNIKSTKVPAISVFKTKGKMVPIQCTSFVLWLVAAPMGFNTSTNQRMFKIIIHIFSYLNNYNCPSSFWQHLQTVKRALWGTFFRALFYHFLKKHIPIWLILWFLTKHEPKIIPAPPERTMPNWESHSFTRMIYPLFVYFMSEFARCNHDFENFHFLDVKSWMNS